MTRTPQGQERRYAVFYNIVVSFFGLRNYKKDMLWANGGYISL
jgi:hypothetical protein